MPRGSTAVGDAFDGRDARIVPVIEDAIARRLKGEDLSDETIIGAHPELMPDLRDFLGELRIVEAARGARPIDRGLAIRHVCSGQ